MPAGSLPTIRGVSVLKFLRALLAVALALALFLTYVPVPVSAGPVLPQTVRIGLFFDDYAHHGASNLSLSGPGGLELGQSGVSGFNLLKAIPAGSTATASIAGGHIVLAGSGWSMSVPGDIFVARPAGSGQSVNVAEKGRSYRGLIEVSFAGGNLKVVNELSVEDYLRGVVPMEMSDSWPIEALKAQAVAARTYVAANVARYGSLGFDLTDDQYSQAYGGVNVEGNNSLAAVDGTSGQILVYNGQPISALYHSNSGGYTENSENVWLSALPYLRGVPDPYSLGQGSSTDNWTVTKSKEYLQDRINSLLSSSGKASIGSLTGITVLNTGVSGRLTKIRLDGTQGSATVTNDLIRYYIGDLDSNLFQILTDSGVFSLGQSQSLTESQGLAGKYVVRGNGEIDQLGSGTITIAGSSSTRQVGSQPEDYTFQGKGWGHGVGMSQWGAYGMAKAGKGYREILTYYYQGTQLTQ